MRLLFEKFRTKIEETPITYIRDIHNKIEWNDRLIAIVGARGVGKSTLILQHIKLHENIDKTLYVSADDLWFSNHSLYELADSFYKDGGKNLYIDEIHKYRNWEREIKNIYDTFSKIKVVFTGSSILDIEKGSADLSRRLLKYHLYGLSFREYLGLSLDLDIPIHTLDQVLENKINFPYNDYRPLALFKRYLQEGYYPYFNSQGYYIRLSQVINRVLEVDIPSFTDLTISKVEKLKKLLYIIVNNVPFKPNYSKLGRELDMSRNSVNDLIVLLGKADLLNLLREESKGIGLLGKVDKIYLSNPNLSYALSETLPDLGNLRETIFLASTKVTNTVYASKDSDFKIGKYTFEVGGKNKGHRQIKGIPDSYIVKDDIEYGFRNEIPLWAFGLLY